MPEGLKPPPTRADATAAIAKDADAAPATHTHTYTSAASDEQPLTLPANWNPFKTVMPAAAAIPFILVDKEPSAGSHAPAAGEPPPGSELRSGEPRRWRVSTAALHSQMKARVSPQPLHYRYITVTSPRVSPQPSRPCRPRAIGSSPLSMRVAVRRASPGGARFSPSGVLKDSPAAMRAALDTLTQLGSY